MAAEEGVTVPKDFQEVFAHVILPSGQGSAIGRAYRALHLEDRDVIFLRAGIRVSRNWEHLLCSVACLDDVIAAVSPLSARDPFFSLTAKPPRRPLDPDATTQWLQSACRKKIFDVPVYLRSCVFFRSAALMHLGDHILNLSDDALAQALWAAGWTLVGFEALYVDDSRIPWENRDPLLMRREDIQDFLRQHPLTGLRWAFANRSAEGPNEAGTKPIRPTQLHVAHSWGGGLGQWVEDFLEADKERHNLVLRSIGTWGRFGQRLALYAQDSPIPIREWNLSLPIRATAVSHYEYKHVLREILETFGVEVILVSSVIGHSLDVYRTGLKTIGIFHDFYPICPYLYLYFFGECVQCTENIIQSCFAHNPLPQIFRNVTPSDFLLLRKNFVDTLIAEKIPLVAPSPSVFRNLLRIEPRLAHLERHVIPHGIPTDFASEQTGLSTRRSDGGQGKGLHVLVPGRLSKEKGQSVLLEVIGRLAHPFTFTLLGCGEDGALFKTFPNVTIVSHYRRKDLPMIAKQLNPDIGLLASIVPETFSYTLSELWALRIPPVVTTVGSFLDRVQDGVSGWVCEPRADAIVQTLRQLEASPHSIDQVARHLKDMPFRTNVDMVRDYHDLVPVAFWDRKRRVFLCAEGSQAEPHTPSPKRALYIDPQVPFRSVLVQFLDYVEMKMHNTPRWRPIFRIMALFPLRLFKFLVRAPLKGGGSRSG
ncbi:glycosyltransferase [Desulfosoma sp.]|uniref:glycosyltransferase n=1 Tax=Desulfosoma sp. TaxID=2603217 RepID=UPI00404B96E9